MFVGILSFDILIRNSQSLKYKRHILSVLKNKIREKFNASVIESNYKNKWQRAELSVALLRENRAALDRDSEAVVGFVELYPQVELLNWEVEVV